MQSSHTPILVTGATGFIGRYLVDRLLQDGLAVRALVLPDEHCSGIWQGAVEVVRGDVTAPASLAPALQGVQHVFHLAARVGDWGAEAEYQQVSVQGTRNVCLAALQAGAQVILTSSIVVYGDALGRDVCDEQHPFGRAPGPYSRAKQGQEQVAWALAQEQGLKLSVVRPGNVYGVGSRVWVDMVAAHLRSGLPSLIDGGEKVAGLVHVRNLVELFVRLLHTPAAQGRVYNGLEDSPVTWKQYFSDIARLVGAPSPRPMPMAVARGMAYLMEGVGKLVGMQQRPPVTYEALNLTGSHHRIPIARARQELGYQPLVSYAQAMQEIAVYLQQAHQVPG